MNKQNYIIPQTDVIAIKTSTILAVSGRPIDDTTTPSTPFISDIDGEEDDYNGEFD